MASSRAKGSPPPHVVKAVNPLYPVGGSSKSKLNRVLRVLAWSAFAAVVTLIVTGLAIWTGGVSLAATQGIAAYLAKQALLGAVEGLLFAGAAELQQKRAVAQALADNIRKQIGERPAVAVRRLSVAELETQIKDLETQLAAERGRAAEVQR